MFVRQSKCRSNTPVLNIKMCVLDQSHRETSDDCQVHVEELNLGVILVLSLSDALTHLVIASRKGYNLGFNWTANVLTSQVSCYL